MAIRIICIKMNSGNHENTLTAISVLGWKNESSGATSTSTREQMYDWVNEGNIAYVKDAQGHTANLIAAKTARGTKYVRTTPDDWPNDNLLTLPECP